MGNLAALFFGIRFNFCTGVELRLPGTSRRSMPSNNSSAQFVAIMNSDLFSQTPSMSNGTTPAMTPIPIEGGELFFLERLPLALPTQEIFSQLLTRTDWRAESITIWGKRHLQPRLIAWYGDTDSRYSYSGTELAPVPWTGLLAEIREQVEHVTGHSFNSVLLNYYRDQNDSVGLHSDNEAELGACPAIASLSFGETRTFTLKHKFNKSIKPLKLRLNDGNLLLMAGATQKNWVHGINKEARPCGPRVNLTFRKISHR
ncbi:alpha-ketoglutarate-dependent dioxygenase AlkB [soil metagenome]